MAFDALESVNVTVWCKIDTLRLEIDLMGANSCLIVSTHDGQCKLGTRRVVVNVPERGCILV